MLYWKFSYFFLPVRLSVCLMYVCLADNLFLCCFACDFSYMSINLLHGKLFLVSKYIRNECQRCSFWPTHFKNSQCIINTENISLFNLQRFLFITVRQRSLFNVAILLWKLYKTSRPNSIIFSRKMEQRLCRASHWRIKYLYKDRTPAVPWFLY